MAPLACASCQAGFTGSAGSNEGAAGGSAAGPSEGMDAAGEDAALGPLPFDAEPPATYVRKLKNLITGDVATAEEIAQGGDDTGLRSLVSEWMGTEAYEDSLLTFFGLALQQSQASFGQLTSQTPSGYVNFGYNPIYQDLQQVVARTALALVKNKQPFNTIASTQTFMVTPNVLDIMALSDTWNAPNGQDWMSYDIPNFAFTLHPEKGAATAQEFGNPKSPNYLIVYCPALKTANTSGNAATCRVDKPNTPLTLAPDFFMYRANAVRQHLNGRNAVYFPPNTGNTMCWTPGCPSIIGSEPGDDSWRPVTFKTPASGQMPTRVWDWDVFRKSDTVYFRIPRVGYFTSMAFLGQWDTNQNNQYRGVINQTLYAGLGKVFDGTDRTVPPDLTAIDPVHSAPNTPCYGCHLTMDPMRTYFEGSFAYNYLTQSDNKLRGKGGSFGQAGQTASGGDIRQLGQMIAASPLFASAWTLKVCAWLNSGECVKDDPEVLRIAKAFAANNYDFNAMFLDVATSPLTTYKKATITATTRGALASIARRDQLCRTLSSRLQVRDFCKLDSRTGGSNPRDQFARLSGTYPRDSYARAASQLAQVGEPGLVSRIGLETLCSWVAEETVDGGATSLFSTSDPNAALDRLMTQLMGLPPQDYPQMRQIFASHYADALAATQDKGLAMRSSVVLACLSPFVSSVGY